MAEKGDEFHCNISSSQVSCSTSQVARKHHTLTRVGKEVDSVGSLNKTITNDSKDNQPSLFNS